MDKMKVADYMANFVADQGVKRVFMISGAGNMHFINSVADNKKLSYVCPHHEQAGVMAAMAYGRITGNIGVMTTTAGGAAANAITGALDAWADSIPVVVISGQEKSLFVKNHKDLRMWGVQGFDIVGAVAGITKYSALVTDPTTIRYHLEKAFYLAKSGRPGPVWLDIPIDVQAQIINTAQLEGFKPEPTEQPDLKTSKILQLITKAKRPVFILGHGIRLGGAVGLVSDLLKKFPFPALSTWNGADIIPGDYNLYYGHEGNYGQRCANFVAQNADLLIAIGTRLAIPQVGYDHSEFARAATKVIVDIDQNELEKFTAMPAVLPVLADAGAFIRELLKSVGSKNIRAPKAWVLKCDSWKKKYPLVDSALHNSKPGLVNSYVFIDKLAKHFGPKEVVVTDMGTALTCTHQCIKLKAGMRLVTSTGLGEMGVGLPFSIGACFANNQKRVILVGGDGSMMMNLQELQTIIHHKLPIKIFIFVNDGYLSIKHTQMGMFGGKFTASGKDSGVTCPDFIKVGKAFGFKTFAINGAKNIDAVIKKVLGVKGPVICTVPMDKYQLLIPKLSFSVKPDGTLVSPPIEDLFPFLPRRELSREMIIGLHEKSKMINDPIKKKGAKI